jgi:glycosyltransferase involved in cell wall biosynthesis
MISGKKIVCVLPAYNAGLTLAKTLSEVPAGIVDLFILVDDFSSDHTLKEANRLSKKYPMKIIGHKKNQGYGANQKTCYRHALAEGADVVVMLHPDYQYEPKLLGCLVSMITEGVYDVALGSRILGKGALSGGMPLYKFVGNRALTFVQNILIGQKLSEYHTGYRAFSRQALEMIPLSDNSDNFVFDNEILVQCVLAGLKIGEVSVPTKYFKEASSINFQNSVVYGFGVLRCSFSGLIGRMLCEGVTKQSPRHSPNYEIASLRSQ